MSHFFSKSCLTHRTSFVSKSITSITLMILFVMMFISSFSVLASSVSQTSAQTSAQVEKVKSNLHSKFPKLDLEGFKAISEVPNLYEFTVNGQKAYTNSNIDYVLVGELLVKQGDKVINLTKQSIENNRSQLFNDLPKNQAIKIVYGKGERKIAVFEDPNCPFCQNFETDLAARGPALNATEYVYLFPLESLHPGATSHAEYIWCSKDPASTWTSWMTFAGKRLRAALSSNQPEPNQDMVWSDWLASTHRPQTLDCGDKGQKLVKANIELGYGFNFHQTPILLFSNGTMFPAALPMDKLEKAFKYAEQN